MKGTVFSIQRFSTHDGPGIRTTVFFKGCPLRCKWCHNPEGLSFDVQTQFFKDKCICCGICAGQRSAKNASACPSQAITLCGTEMSANEIMDVVLKDERYYKDGGVTFSGGECTAQPELLLECLQLAKDHGLHTAVDTSGYAPWSVFSKTLDLCDLYLYDVKCADPDLHKRFTGVDNTLILENLRRLSCADKPIWIRIPAVVGFNASVSEMTAISDILRGIKNVEKVTVMPYHSLGKSKYETLGLKASDFDVPKSELMAQLNNCFNDWMK